MQRRSPSCKINVVGNQHGDPSSILGEAVCISLSADTIGKCMNPTALPLAIGKIVGQTELFSLGMPTALREENFEIKPFFKKKQNRSH